MTRRRSRRRTPAGSVSPAAEQQELDVGLSWSEPDAPLESTLESRLEQARELENAGHVDRAIELYQAVVREAPDHIPAHYALGLLYDRTGRHLEALEQYERAKRVDPDNIELLINHANVTAALGRFEAAERELRRAAKLDPTRPRSSRRSA